jgi:hypothetical protein
MLKAGSSSFTFPLNSFIGIGKKLKLPFSVTELDFQTGEEIKLLYPNGSLASSRAGGQAFAFGRAGSFGYAAAEKVKPAPDAGSIQGINVPGNTNDIGLKAAGSQIIDAKKKEEPLAGSLTQAQKDKQQAAVIASLPNENSNRNIWFLTALGVGIISALGFFVSRVYGWF